MLYHSVYSIHHLAFRAVNVLNNKKNDFYCKATLEVEGVEYFIERFGKRHKNGHVKVNVDFYSFDDAGEKISFNGDQRRTTQLNIRKLIGTYEDFVMTALSLQTNSTVFIDKTQKKEKSYWLSLWVSVFLTNYLL